MKEIVVITSAIHTVPGIPNYEHGGDDALRLRETLCSLLCWIRCPAVGSIVFCDGTMPRFDFASLVQYAKLQGKTLEILLFQQRTEDVRRFGVGNGEGQIMEYAFTHSAILRHATVFYKVTGRTFVENFDTLSALHVNDEIVFSPLWKFSPLLKDKFHIVLWRIVKNLFRQNILLPAAIRRFHHALLTQCYKCTVTVFNNHLRTCYLEIEEKMTYALESLYAQHLQGIPFVPFSTPPIVIGRQGGSGLPYGKKNYPADIQQLATTFSKPQR